MREPSSNWQSPLASRYASEAMRENFSDKRRFRLWRELWIALAEAERELGLPIREEQVEEMRRTIEPIDVGLASRYERELRHDVMAHIHAWGERCPKARPIIHLGATSCFVTDNAELVILREGLAIVRRKLVSAIAALRRVAHEQRELPTLGFTHYQPAQATTVGKRACLWLQDLVDDLDELAHQSAALRFRGVKGTTGTQTSFLELFEGDHDKVEALDAKVAEKMGFGRRYLVTGQTYPRKADFRVAQVLSGIAQSAHKMAVDLRLLANRRELEEPFEEHQIGSSAMPWKRNPMRSERICALARHVICALDNTAHTAANQWLERTLDDSANRRIVLAEMFLGTDAVLNLVLNVAGGLIVNEHVVRRNLDEELPFLASETLMMEAVKAGADRQEAHEAIRRASHAAAADIKAGRENSIRTRLAADPLFASVAAKLDQILDPRRFVGRAPEQVDTFLAQEVDPRLETHREDLGEEGRVEL